MWNIKPIATLRVTDPIPVPQVTLLVINRDHHNRYTVQTLDCYPRQKDPLPSSHYQHYVNLLHYNNVVTLLSLRLDPEDSAVSRGMLEKMNPFWS